MCLQSVGEDVGCTEIKTHEVELILKTKSVLGFTDENKWRIVMAARNENISQNVGDSQSWTCENVKNIRFLFYRWKLI